MPVSLRSVAFYERQASTSCRSSLMCCVGDMSLVGPRPHACAHDDEYAQLIGNYAFRHHIKPGITGWAQVNGLRGETPHLDLMKRRIELDIWYINNWSIWLDLRILAPHLRGAGQSQRLLSSAWNLERSTFFRQYLSLVGPRNNNEARCKVVISAWRKISAFDTICGLARLFRGDICPT